MDKVVVMLLVEQVVYEVGVVVVVVVGLRNIMVEQDVRYLSPNLCAVSMCS